MPPDVVVATVPIGDVAAFLDEITMLVIERNPEWATDLGLADTHDTLTSLDPASTAATAQLASGALDRLLSATPSSDAERLSVDVMKWWLDDLIEGSEYQDHEYTVSFITGPHVNLPEFLVDIHPMRTAQHADDYLARLRHLATSIDQVSARVLRAADAGILMPAAVRDIAMWQTESFGDVDPRRHSLITEFRRRMEEAGIDQSDRENRAIEILREDVFPAYRRLAQVLSDVPVRATAGVWDLPGGNDYYRWALRHYTTVDTEPLELHDWGLRQVDRVRGDLEATLLDLGYEVSDVNAALSRAIQDAGRVDLDSDEARRQFLESSRNFVDHVENATTEMFMQSPSADLIIRRPDPSREGGTGAWYRGPDLVGERPGIYYLAMAASSRAAHNHATTTVHEGVPGHHFQLGLQVESDNPLHQRAVVFSGFAEGWALYAERLAWEAGIYEDDPFGNIGRLQMELLRAARVVADTGIHAKQWTREQAIDYLEAAAGLEPRAAQSEVDRYIVWPGQAAGYLVGMDQILQARTEAEGKLGDKFVLAEFHDVILGSGSLPLPIMRDAVDAWIRDRSAR